MSFGIDLKRWLDFPPSTATGGEDANHEQGDKADDWKSESSIASLDSLQLNKLIRQMADACTQTEDFSHGCSCRQNPRDSTLAPLHAKAEGNKPQPDRFAKKLLSSHFHFSDSYIFEAKPICNRLSTHEIALRNQNGSPVQAKALDISERGEILRDLDDMLPSLGNAMLGPKISFAGHNFDIKCHDQVYLEQVLNILRAKETLGSYRIKLVSLGLPFQPAFWSIQGLKRKHTLRRLSADLQSFATLNEKSLGKLRVAYASCRRGDGPSGDPVFTRNILLVTEADTVTQNHQAVFHYIMPRRRQVALLPL